MKTRKTKTLRLVVFNNQESDEFIKATLTVKYKYKTALGYRVETKDYQYVFNYDEHKQLYYAIKFNIKEAISYAKWMCSVYGDLIYMNTKDYYED